MAMRADGSAVHELHSGYAAAVVWSPDGAHVLLDDGHLTVAEVGDDIGPFVRTGIAVPEAEQWEAFDYAPDGEHVAFVRKSKCAGRTPAGALGSSPVILAVAHIAETAGANCLVVSIADLATGTLTDFEKTLVKDQTREQNRSLELPAWSPDGTKIAYTVVNQDTDTRDLWIVAVDGRAASKVQLDRDVSVTEPRWSPDGTRISFTDQRWVSETTSQSSVDVVDLASGHVVQVATDSSVTDGQVCCAEWIDDDQLRIRGATTETLGRFWQVSADGRSQQLQVWADLTAPLAAIEPPGSTVTVNAPGDPGRTFFWQP